MMLPRGAIVAIADGEKLNLMRNAGDEAVMRLVALPQADITAGNSGTDGHQSSSGNPDAGQAGEDGFSAGVVAHLNAEVLAGRIENLVVIAAPRALGEMRKHYHKALSAILRKEIAKDLTGHGLADVEKAVASA